MILVPTYEADLFTDEALLDPYAHYRALRNAGPVVWLSAHEVYAVARYADVRTILDDATTFCSGQGVGLNHFINEGGRGTTLMSDGDEHRRQREVIGRPLTPSRLAELRPEAQEISDRVVDDLVNRGSFDAVSDLAAVLPATWVPNLLGWPESGRTHLLDWANASFDGLGPLNERAAAAGPGLLEMTAFAHQLAQSDLPPASMAAGVLEAAAAGDIDATRCPMVIIDYLAPSLDTTISAVGNAMWLFATHPEQWQLLRDDPSRVKHAFNEVLRVESPINCFSRVVTTDTTIDDVDIAAGARILVSFASANRDERRWDRADEFDITRESAGHVAFGFGIHACAGMGLARLEGAAILSALVDRVETIELVGAPVRKLNNLIRAFRSVPVRVTAA
ncbi:MAG TPA: cytochrome P450 [Acidimicrobiales bacterium]